MEKLAGRRRNPRGEGRRLREEILDAAAALLEATGAEESVTLRSVAREVGIAAPSIYAHFPDREAIVDAVVDGVFAHLREITSAAGAGQTDPVQTLLAGCHAYADFALGQPGRYRILFGRSRAPGATTKQSTPARTAALRVLADAIAGCVAAGRSASTDPWADAVELWSAMHGALTLRIGLKQFPWPPVHDSIDTLARRIAQVTPPGDERHGPAGGTPG